MPASAVLHKANTAGMHTYVNSAATSAGDMKVEPFAVRMQQSQATAKLCAVCTLPVQAYCLGPGVSLTGPCMTALHSNMSSSSGPACAKGVALTSEAHRPMTACTSMYLGPIGELGPADKQLRPALRGAA